MRQLRKNMAVKRFTALALTCILSAGIVLPVMARPGDTVICDKNGLTMNYKVIQDVGSLEGDKSGSVQLGNGESPAIAKATEGTVFIPNEAMIYDNWEEVRVFRVDRIAANAFKGCEKVTKIHIEGNVKLAPGAFDGLSDEVVFETNSTETKKELLRYGIPYERVKYVGLKTKYVAFGDSIAAGFALDGFNGDAYPAPEGAFVSLVTEAMNTNGIPGAGPALLDNQAVSGWTSQQLLYQLNRGDYDAALKDADVVSITIGSNDLLGPFMNIVAQTFKESGIVDILEKEDRITIRDIKNVIERIPQVIDTLNTNLADNATLNAACETFKNTNMPAILTKVKELAPADADVYWTTLYNPFSEQVFDLEELFPNLANSLPENATTSIDLGTLGAKYIEKMNEAFAANQNGYHRVDLYDSFNNSGLVNVKFERGGEENNPTLVLNFDPHPNAAGHEMIAEKLIAAIETREFKDPPADLSHEKQFTEFSIAGGQGTISEADGQISVSVPYGTDVTRQAAVFTASEKATVYVGDTLQESGVTVNDYAQPVTYTVFAEDETSREYTVTVTEEQKPVPVKEPEKGGAGGTTPAVKTKNLAVKTGDDTSVMGLFCLMAAAGAVVLIAGRRKWKN